MPLKLIWSPSHPPLPQGSCSIPLASVRCAIVASAIGSALASKVASPVASYSSARPPSTTPWLYVHVVCPLFVHTAASSPTLSPSLIRPDPPIIPLPWNQAHSF